MNSSCFRFLYLFWNIFLLFPLAGNLSLCPADWYKFWCSVLFVAFSEMPMALKLRSKDRVKIELTRVKNKNTSFVVAPAASHSNSWTWIVLWRERLSFISPFFGLVTFIFCTKKVHVIILKYTAADEITVHMHALKTPRYLDMYDKISGSFQWNPPAGFWNRTARLEFAKTTDSIDIDGPPSSTFAAAQRQKSTPNTPMHREKIRAVYGYSFFDGIREIFS